MVRACCNQVEGANKIRFVHISDTHNYHEYIHLPEGDVLLHTGDIVGNYGKQDLKQHLRSFRQWIQQVSTRFQLVVFIAGNVSLKKRKLHAT